MQSPSPTVQVLDSVRADGLRFEKLRYLVGEHRPRHAHRELFIDLSLSGLIEGRARYGRFQRAPAEVTYIPIGEPHYMAPVETATTLQIVVEPEWLELNEVPTGGFELFDRCPPSWIALRIAHEYSRRDDLSTLVLEELLRELLAAVADRSCFSLGHRVPDWLRTAEEYLRANLTSKIEVTALAREVGIAPAHLMRTFRRSFGCTIGEYVRGLRVELARFLMSRDELSLSEIAYDVGFADQSHLCHAFKERVGVSPSTYRGRISTLKMSLPYK